MISRIGVIDMRNEGGTWIKYICASVGVALILVGIILIFLSVSPNELGRASTSSYEDLVKRYLGAVDSEIRSAAINILNSYIRSHYIVFKESVRVGARSSKLIRFDYYYPFIYELTVSVSGGCIGVCDIGVRILDSGFSTVWFKGRVSYYRENLTILQNLGMLLSEQVKTYYLELDNTYSILTPKDVYVVIKAYTPVDRVFNDKAYKIMAIALWATYNIRYVSDPYRFEYIADPRETLKIRAGDCDDLALLLASLYRSVGLRSAVGLIDTDGDKVIDHAVALVALRNDEIEYLKNSVKKYSMIFGKEFEACISYFKRDGSLWLILDPLFATGDEPWCIKHHPYYLIKLIE